MFQVNAIVDATAALGSQSISAATTDTTAAKKDDVETAINNIQTALDAILALTTVSC